MTHWCCHLGADKGSGGGLKLDILKSGMPARVGKGPMCPIGDPKNTDAGYASEDVPTRRTARWAHRDATMILVAYRHGLRASEAADLRWDQVDFGTATLQGSPSTHMGRLSAVLIFSTTRPQKPQ
jgi:hypothetical protein